MSVKGRTFDFNPRRNPEDLRKVLLDFVADAPAGWAVYGDDKPYAARRFEYPGGQMAQLSLVLGNMGWQAQINIPVSVGAQEIERGADVKDVRPWIIAKERVLITPFRVAECKSYDAAFEMLARLDSSALYTLSYVLDIETSMTTAAVIRHRVIVASGLARKGE